MTGAPERWCWVGKLIPCASGSYIRCQLSDSVTTRPARALKSCSSVMQQSVSIRRPLLVSGRYVLVNIILDMSLAYGLTTRPRANTIIDTVTYLVDGTYRRWFWEVF